MEYEIYLIGYNLYCEIIEFLFNFETNIYKNHLLYAHTLDELEKLCIEINSILELEKQIVFRIHLFNAQYYDLNTFKQNSIKNCICLDNQTTLTTKLSKFKSAFPFFQKLMSLFETELISESMFINSINNFLHLLLKFKSDLNFVFAASFTTLLDFNFQNRLVQLARLSNDSTMFQDLFMRLCFRNYSLHSLTNVQVSKKLLRVYDIIRNELIKSGEKEYKQKNILIETSAEQLKPKSDFTQYFQNFLLPPTLYFVECSQFFQKYLGEGEKAVTEFFNLRKNNTYNILWIQNIELIGNKNISCQFAQSLLTTIQIELDGISLAYNKKSLVVATTNDPLNELHYSLTRPGRFDIWLNDLNLN